MITANGRNVRTPSEGSNPAWQPVAARGVGKRKRHRARRPAADAHDGAPAFALGVAGTRRAFPSAGADRAVTYEREAAASSSRLGP